MRNRSPVDRVGPSVFPAVRTVENFLLRATTILLLLLEPTRAARDWTAERPAGGSSAARRDSPSGTFPEDGATVRWPKFGESPTRRRGRPVDVATDAINDLGMKILDRYVEDGRGNVAFSPSGLGFVLVALYEGAAGSSAREISEVLGLPRDRRLTRIGLRDVHRRLRSYLNADAFLGGLTLNREDINLREDYERILRFYGFDVSDSPTDNNESTSSSSGNATDEIETLPSTKLPGGDTTATIDSGTTASSSSPSLNVVPTTASSSNPSVTDIPTTASSSSPSVTDVPATASSSNPSVTDIPTTASSSNPSVTDIPTTPSSSSPSVTDIPTTASSSSPFVTDIPTIVSSSPSVTDIPTIASSSPAVTDIPTTALSSPSVADIPTTAAAEPAGINAMMLMTTTTTTTATPAATATPSIPVTTPERTDTSTRQRRGIFHPPFGYFSPYPTENVAWWLDEENGRFNDNVDYPSEEGGIDDDDDDDDSRRPTEIVFLVNGCDYSRVTGATYTAFLPFSHFASLRASLLEFPLDDPRYKILVMLPNEAANGTRDLARTLATRPFTLRKLRASLGTTWLTAVVPSFMLRGFVTLTPYLQRLGISDVFDPRAADLTPMSPDLGVYARDVQQSIGLNIRNNGREKRGGIGGADGGDGEPRPRALLAPPPFFLAGGTISPRFRGNGRRPSYPGGPLYRRATPIVLPFVLDRPFLYFIVDDETSITLLAGRIDDPLNSRLL